MKKQFGHLGEKQYFSTNKNDLKEGNKNNKIRVISNILLNLYPKFILSKKIMTII
jgi:hypothetical protein